MSAEHYDKDTQNRIKQLEAELEIAHQQLALAQKQLVAQQQRLEAKRQEFICEHGPELLALLEGDSRAKVFITPVVEKLVFQDQEGLQESYPKLVSRQWRASHDARKI